MQEGTQPPKFVARKIQARDACQSRGRGLDGAMPRKPAGPENPRRVLIAPDKFKGTLSADAAAAAIARGVARAWPGVETTCLGLTDGGEGFVEMMVAQTGGRLRTSPTIDAVWRPCPGRWGVLGDKKTAVFGLAGASGIAQLPPNLRNPELTSNLGTGQLIAHALEKGYRQILIGLGGSATNEGGISLAAAIGYRFLDRGGMDIPLDGRGLARLDRIVPPRKKPRAQFTVATDVDNPLTGPLGAARQFAAQKGANEKMIERLEVGLQKLARLVQRDLGLDLAREPGAGAAGGCGYGLMTFFRAKRENGFQLIRRTLKLDALIRASDLVITGEGCFDRTSLLGKGPAQIGLLARRLGVPAWALCGRATLPAKGSPFDQIAALSTPENPGPPLETLSPAQHVRRLEELAFELARGRGQR
jgi:glycerate kinase